MTVFNPPNEGYGYGYGELETARVTKRHYISPYKARFLI